MLAGEVEAGLRSDGPGAAPGRRPGPLDALDAVAVTLATAFGAGLVLFELGTKSIWVDEAATVATARQHGATLWYWLLHDGGNMFGYYTLMHVVVEVFGSGPTVLRLPAALSFIATIPCSYFLMRRMFDRRAAVFGSFLVAASAPLVLWGQNARAYLPAVFLVTAAALALVVAVQDRRRSAWIWFVVCGGLAAYMILLASLVVVAQLAALFLLPRRELEIRRAAWSSAAVIVLWLPMGAAALHRGAGQLNWIGPSNLDADQYLGRFVLSAPFSVAASWIVLAACVAGAALLAVRLVRHGRSAEAFAPGLLVAWIVLPIILLFATSALVQPVLVDRYFLPMVPAASMLAGAACSRLRPAPVAWAAAAALVTLRAYQVPAVYGTSLEAWPGATSYVVDRLQPHDCVGFFVADGFDAFDYYLGRLPGPHPAVPPPVLPAGASYAADTPFVLDPATIPAAQMPHVLAICRRVWIVETHQTGAPAGPDVPSYQVAKFEAAKVLDNELGRDYSPIRGTKFMAVFVVLWVRH